MAQCRTVLEALHRAAQGGPCILAGDFNSHPGSAVHRFCRNGALHLAGEDRRCMSGQKAPGSSPIKVPCRRQCQSASLLLASLSLYTVRATQTAVTKDSTFCGTLVQRWEPAELHTALGHSSVGRDDQTVQHPLPLGSAYEAVTGLEAAFSTSHGKATAGKTVDYVWYRPQVGCRLGYCRTPGSCTSLPLLRRRRTDAQLPVTTESVYVCLRTSL